MDSVNSKISPERKVRNVCVSMIRAKRDRTEKKMYIHLSKVLRRLKKSKKESVGYPNCAFNLL